MKTIFSKISTELPLMFVPNFNFINQLKQRKMVRKLTNTLMALLAICLFTQCNDDDNIDPKLLPEAAKVFLETHYPNQTYTVEKDAENGQTVYEVDLKNGVEVEFTENGECIYVGGRTTEVPKAVLSSKIEDYIDENYSGVRVVEWEIEDNYQEVELSNNVELIFDLDGNFKFSRNDHDDDDDEVVVDESELPVAAKNFINEHFEGATIVTVIKESEGNIVEYEVILSNSFNLDFDANGKCINIEGMKNQQIPDTALDAKLVSYVTSNYPNNFIVEWDLDTREQEVELNNGTELVFDTAGNFKYIDN